MNESSRRCVFRKSKVVEGISMKKEVVSLLIAVTVILGFILPKPVNTVVSLLILVPTAIYLIVDIIKNGNSWKK